MKNTASDYAETHCGRVRVGECPACKFPLFGDVILTSTLGKPYWVDVPNKGSRPHVNSSVKISGMELHHECGGPGE